MRYVTLGPSAIRVSELCLGAMTFNVDGPGSGRQESGAIFEAFVAAGGNFVDTASLYTGGQSEVVVGELIAPDRERFVVATKYSLWDGTEVVRSGNSRKALVTSLERSLRALRTEYVDVLYLHCWDGVTTPEVAMAALHDVVASGKVLAIGLSNVPAWWLARAATVAELRGTTPVSACQVWFNLIERSAESEILPAARHLGVQPLCFGPLHAGALTASDHARRRADTPRAEAIRAALDDVARDAGVTSAQAALAWIRQQEWGIVPILGAFTATELRDSLGSLDVTLSYEQLDRLDEVSRLEPVYPHVTYDQRYVQDLLTSGQTDTGLQLPR
jgi:aryl-alcohol dehydrogenase-like predicted oxidoreductase